MTSYKTIPLFYSVLYLWPYFSYGSSIDINSTMRIKDKWYQVKDIQVDPSSDHQLSISLVEKSFQDRDLNRFAPVWTESQRQSAKNLLQKADKLMKEKKITWFLLYGSLLGALRHGEPIPWDDDLDIGVVSSDISALLQSELDFKRAGIRISKFFGGYRFSWLADEPKLDIENSPFSFPYIDVFICEERSTRAFGVYKEGIIIQTRTPWEEAHPTQDCYLKNEIFPLTTVEFYGLEFPAPSDPVAWVKKQYGERCLKEAVAPALCHSQISMTGFDQTPIPLETIEKEYKLKGYFFPKASEKR